MEDKSDWIMFANWQGVLAIDCPMFAIGQIMDANQPIMDAVRQILDAV